MHPVAVESRSSIPKSLLQRAGLALDVTPVGNNEKGLSAFEQAARIEPTTARIHVGLGFAYFKLAKYKDALNCFEYARKLDDDVNYALLGMGATYAQLKDYKTAEKLLRDAIRSDPAEATAHYNLGMVCLARKNRNCALSQYNQLKMMGHPLAVTLFDTLFQNRVLQASTR